MCIGSSVFISEMFGDKSYISGYIVLTLSAGKTTVPTKQKNSAVAQSINCAINCAISCVVNTRFVFGYVSGIVVSGLRYLIKNKEMKVWKYNCLHQKT